jgi:nitrogen fixation NifU-like protein
MDDADRHIEGFNPLCGDHYTIFLKIDGDIVKEISFDGAGCAISKASASVMSSIVKGKSKAEILALFNEFHELVTGGRAGDESLESLGKLAAFSGVSEFPARVKCASLPWHTLKAALEHDGTVVTTE